uniref:interleukin-18 receptor accessory protein n=1 Tax=Jaculus jaculus TaxID=51337 RepID=UPI001E1B060E|nr:interleukin-18 receptor accessory protein [Jaculus jaculus]
MLCLSWALLVLVAGETTTGFHNSDCSTKQILWIYSVKSEEFVLFCDLLELHYFYRSQHSPTQGPDHPVCSSSKDLSDVQWYRQPQSGGPFEEISSGSPYIIQDKNILAILAPLMNNTGPYICRPRIRSPQDTSCCIKIVLEVKAQTNISCENSVQHTQYLLLGSVGTIYCPSLSCQSDSQSPAITWYQNGRLLLEEKSNPIKVGEIYDYHQGTYVCDYSQLDNGSSWMVRDVVHVKTIVPDTESKPNILDPIKDTMEVELGRPFTLPCKVQFGFQRDFKPVIRWYVKDSTQQWEVPIFEEKRLKSSFKDEVIEHTIFFKEVTQRDLGRKFVCFAQNSIGNTTWTVQLREKKGVVFTYILLGTVVTLVGMLGAGAILYMYWIEIVLLYRTYHNKDETLTDKKEFDAFISYAKWSSFGNEAISFLSEEYLALNLFPEILENKYGYTLCLLERDVVPGGAYAEDIVSIIKKSRRGIFILSPNYINGPSVFELQAAVNLALVDQTLKLILIKFHSFKEPESLPHVVRKALRVLPTITWRGLKSIHPNSKFWTQMHYHMPVKNPKRFMWNKLRVIPKVLSLERTK